MKKLHIFRTGTHTDMGGSVLQFSNSDLAEAAASYDPTLYEAPLVVGHPKMDAPAYGWVSGLESNAQGLWAEPKQVEPQFAGLVNEGRFKHISVAMWTPQAKTNPKPGSYYLRHVGFLGAVPPAVHGLKTAEFAQGADESDGDTVTVRFAVEPPDPAPPLLTAPALPIDTTNPTDLTEPAKTTLEFSMDTKDKMLVDLQAKIDKLEADAKAAEATAASQAEFADKEAALVAKEAELADKLAQAEARNKVLLAAEKQTAQSGLRAFADELVAKGQIVPADKASVVAFMASLDEKAEVSFADEKGDHTRSSLDWFKNFVNTRMPATVNYTETAGADTNPNPTGASAGISDAEVAKYAGVDPNTQMDAASTKMYKQAIAYCKQHGKNPADTKELETAIDIVTGAGA